MKSEAFEQFMDILFLRASDQGNYRKMKDEYHMEYVNKKDNCPKSVVDMIDIMRKIKISRKKSPEKGKSDKDKKKNPDVKSEIFSSRERETGSYAMSVESWESWQLTVHLSKRCQ